MTRKFDAIPDAFCDQLRDVGLLPTQINSTAAEAVYWTLVKGSLGQEQRRVIEENDIKAVELSVLLKKLEHKEKILEQMKADIFEVDSDVISNLEQLLDFADRHTSYERKKYFAPSAILKNAADLLTELTALYDEINKCVSAEAKDRVYLARRFKAMSPKIETCYDRTAYINAIGSILAGTSIKTEDEVNNG